MVPGQGQVSGSGGGPMIPEQGLVQCLGEVQWSPVRGRCLVECEGHMIRDQRQVSSGPRSEADVWWTVECEGHMIRDQRQVSVVPSQGLTVWDFGRGPMIPSDSQKTGGGHMIPSQGRCLGK